MNKMDAGAPAQVESEPFLRPSGESLIFTIQSQEGEALEAALRAFGQDAEFVMRQPEALVLTLFHRYDLMVLDYRCEGLTLTVKELIDAAHGTMGTLENDHGDDAPAVIIVTDPPDSLAIPCANEDWTDFVLEHDNVATISLPLNCPSRDIETMLASAIRRQARMVAQKRLRAQPSHRVRNFLLAELKDAWEVKFQMIANSVEARRHLNWEAFNAFMLAEEEKIAHLPKQIRRMEAKLVEIEFGIPTEVFQQLEDPRF